MRQKVDLNQRQRLRVGSRLQEKNSPSCAGLRGECFCSLGLLYTKRQATLFLLYASPSLCWQTRTPAPALMARVGVFGPTNCDKCN